MTTPTPQPSRMNAQPRFVVASFITLLIVVLAFVVFHNGVPGKNNAGSPITKASPAPPTPTVGAIGSADVAAYLGADHHLHIVTATGHDTTGPTLPQTSIIDTTQGVSPSLVAGTTADGRYIGYVASDQGNGIGSVEVYDIGTQKLTKIPAHATALYFAPTGTRFVANDTTQDSIPAPSTSLTVGDAATGKAKVIPLTNGGATATEERLLGWSDASHVVILADLPATTARAAALVAPYGANMPAAIPASGGPSGLLLAKVDVSTGKLTGITTIPLPSNEPFLSGDGTEVWLAPTYSAATSSVIDLATGKTHDLPTIASAFTGKFHNLDSGGFTQSGNWATHFAAIPGTHVFYASLSKASQPNEDPTQPTTQDAGVWQVDLDHDTAQQLEHNHYPLSFAPDGAGIFVCDIPAFQPVMLNSGFVTGPTLGFFAPASTTGKTTTLATTMVAYFGLVKE